MSRQFAVFYISQHYGIFIHHTDTHIQGTSYAVCAGSNGQACIHVHVIDSIFVAGLNLYVFCIIYRRIGHRGDSRTVHLVCVDIIASLESSHRTTCHCAGHVEGRHSLLRVRSNIEVFGIDIIFCFFSCSNILLAFRRFGGHACRCDTRNLVGSAGKARRAGQFLPNSHRSRAAELRHVGVIRRMDVHIAAIIGTVKIGIQHLRDSRAAHIVQVHYAGQSAAERFLTGSYCHTAVGHSRGNAMGSRSIHYHTGLLFLYTALLQPAYAVRLISLSFFKGTTGPGASVYRALYHVFFVFSILFQLALCLDNLVVIISASTARSVYRTVLNQRFRLAGNLII